MSFVAGAAVEPFRFEDGLPMAGFAARTSPSTGTHDELSARALALGDGDAAAIIVVADLTSLSPQQSDEVRARVAEATGVPVFAVSVCVTHTHSAPSIDPWMTTPVADVSVQQGALDTIVRAAVSAAEQRAPARISRASGAVPLAVNRRHPAGPVDDALDVLRVDRTDGSPIAIAFVYACHPTIVGPENTLLSADWPGAARAVVEAAVPGAVALYLQGFTGDCNVGHSAHASLDGSSANPRTPEEGVRRGAALGRAVVALLEEASPVRGPLATGSSVWDWQWSAADAVEPPQQNPPSVAAALIAGLEPAWRSRLGAAQPEGERISVSFISVGDTVFVLASGEPFASLGLELRRLRRRARVIPVGYANGVPGYLPYPPAERDCGGYEVEEAHVVYGRPTALPAGFAEHVLVSARTWLSARGRPEG